MSQHGHTDSDVESGPHDSLDIPDQVLQDSPNKPADSEALFAAYLDRALKEDKAMVERWKNTADGLLVFIGLFSTVVATFLAVSVPFIQRNPQDTSSFYLAQIYQQLSTQPNGSQPSIPSSLINPIEPFVPPASTAWACGLWFLSLVITLTCALVAISLQQWARRYLQLAHENGDPYKRACLRSFYKSGVDKLNTLLNIEWVPMLLHVALFLFFAGISVYLFGVHRTIFKVVTAWIGVCIGSYAILTVLPTIYKDTPCSSPFSSFFYSCLAGIRYIFVRLRRFPLIFLSRYRLPTAVHIPTAVQLRLVKAAEQYALKLELESSIGNRSLLWESWKLKDDSDHEKFFEGFSQLCHSEGESEVKKKFIEPNKDKLSKTLIDFIDRTFSSNLINATVKYRRMIIFTEIIGSKSTPLLDRSLVLKHVLFGKWDTFVEYIGFGLLMKIWADTPNEVMVSSFYAQCVATLITSTIPSRDKRWIQIAQILPTSLHNSEDRHSILLAHAIYIVRMSVQTYSGSKERDWDQILDASQKTLREACKIEIRSTSFDLQHEFCDLWNKLVRMAQTDQLLRHRVVSLNMLKNIRKLYFALHYTDPTSLNAINDWEDILDNPYFYSECMEYDHRPSSSFPDLQVSKVPASQTPAPAHTPTAMPLRLESFPKPFPPSSLLFSNPLSSQPNEPISMPSPSLGAGGGGGMSPVLKFNGYGEFSGLLYHSPHSVVYEEELYPTALHLFEARKFLDHRPDLADRIRQCERVEDVTAISAELADFTRRDWGNVALSTMDEILYLKFRQHGELRTLLLNTYPAYLEYAESGDPFWGDGGGIGMNELGKSLMRVRERLRSEERN